MQASMEDGAGASRPLAARQPDNAWDLTGLGTGRIHLHAKISRNKR